MNTAVVEVSNLPKLGVMQCEDEATILLPFPVSTHLNEKLERQSEALIHVHTHQSPAERYLTARNDGALAAVAKGAKNRKVERNTIFIPKSELQATDGRVRISALRASVDLPTGYKVKHILFQRVNDDGDLSDDGHWVGKLAVSENPAA